MGLDDVRKTYEEFGKEDPFFAVLSDKRRQGGGWDPEEFFETGRQEIDAALAHLDDLGVTLERHRALDFGCGVGRLTQALARHFQEVVGVDISWSMLETAREHNAHPDRVSYVVNTEPDLSVFESGSFDFIYSNITLQHVPRPAAEAYIQEFCRLLRSGGVALFQVPDGIPFAPGSLGARFMGFLRGPVRRFSKRVRGKKPVEIHYVPRPRVEEIVRRGGCELVEAHDLAGGRKRWGSFRYCIRRTGSGAAPGETP